MKCHFHCLFKKELRHIMEVFHSPLKIRQVRIMRHDVFSKPPLFISLLFSIVLNILFDFIKKCCQRVKVSDGARTCLLIDVCIIVIVWLFCIVIFQHSEIKLLLLHVMIHWYNHVDIFYVLCMRERVNVLN